MENSTRKPEGVQEYGRYTRDLHKKITENGGMCIQIIVVNRFNNLKSAIERYVNANITINPEWLEEYNELLEYFEYYKIKIK